MKVFVEKQQFNQWWFRIIILITITIVIVTLTLSLSETKGDPIAFWVTICTGFFSICLLIFISFYIRLNTQIDEQGIHYAFWPIHLKTRLIPWHDIKECYVKEYSPITDYGGWGYKIAVFRKKGKALTVKGNVGIQIVFHTGKKLLIGIQQEDAAKKVLQTYQHKILV